MSYDQGGFSGWLPPEWTLYRNDTGKPERVLNATEVQAVRDGKRLAQEETDRDDD